MVRARVCEPRGKELKTCEPKGTVEDIHYRARGCGRSSPIVIADSRMQNMNRPTMIWIGADPRFPEKSEGKLGDTL